METANMTSAKPANNPLPLAHPLYEELVDVSKEEEKEMKSVPFRKVLGALLYLCTRTRPDIATAVSMIAKFQSKPTLKHWKLVKQVVRYLIGTDNYGLLLPKNDEGLQCWADADSARDLTKRRSRTGVLITYNGGPVTWISKMQTTTAQSTSEAEFNALSHGIRELKWIREVLNETNMTQSGPTVVYQDNLGSISWTEDTQGLRRVKHVGIKYHFVRDSIETKHVEIKYTPSHLNRSDSLTKVLIGNEFVQHRQWVGVII